MSNNKQWLRNRGDGAVNGAPRRGAGQVSLPRLGPFRKALWWQHLKKQARFHRRPDLSSALLKPTRKQTPMPYYAGKTLGTELKNSSLVCGGPCKCSSHQRNDLSEAKRDLVQPGLVSWCGLSPLEPGIGQLSL